MDIIDVKEELKKFQKNYIYFYPCLESPKNSRIEKLKIQELILPTKKIKELI